MQHISAVAQRIRRVNDLFAQAERFARNSLLSIANADIMLLSDFASAVERIAHLHYPLLMVGQRMDVNITARIDTARPDWEQNLRRQAQTLGTLRPPNAIDYFVFTKGLGSSLLPLALGRRGWDNWFLWHARSQRAAVIDASREVLALHQNHDYSHHPDGSRRLAARAQRNRASSASGITCIPRRTQLPPPPQGLSATICTLAGSQACLVHPRGMVLLVFKLLSLPSAGFAAGLTTRTIRQ